MTRILVPLFLLSLGASAQIGDLSEHVSLIKQLVPNSTRFGVFYNPNDGSIDGQVAKATQDTGIQAVKSPIKSIREVSSSVRSMAKYQVDFIVLIEDKVVTGKNAIKFVVKQTVKKKIPVFTVSEAAFSGGALGQFVNNGGKWQVKINGKLLPKFDISVPDGSDQFIIVEE